MKQSGSSVPGKRTQTKYAGMPKGIKVRYVKFTPEEMAYEPPVDVSDPKRFPLVCRGGDEWRKFLSFKRGFVRLDPELRKAFPDDRSVNEALRAVVNVARTIKHKKVA